MNDRVGTPEELRQICIDDVGGYPFHLGCFEVRKSSRDSDDGVDVRFFSKRLQKTRPNIARSSNDDDSHEQVIPPTSLLKQALWGPECSPSKRLRLPDDDVLVLGVVAEGL